MGCSQSNGGDRRRRNNTNMSAGNSHDSGAASEATNEASSQTDIATILSYLIRSGQARLVGDYDGDDNDSDYYENDGDDWSTPKGSPPVDATPDTTGLDCSELKQELLLEIGHGPTSNKRRAPTDIPRLLQKREHGVLNQQSFSGANCRAINCNYLPNKVQRKIKYPNKAFCGTYSQDGRIFLSACQDRKIRIYDTTAGRFDEFNCIQARDVGWSILDTSFSPDGNYLVYSSWSDYLHLCNIYGEQQVHKALPLAPESENSFCIFSVVFSQDNKEILGGANDRCLYVFDRERNERTLRIDAHEDDVNAVAFADDASHILFSGSDDGLCKVWDRRTLKEVDPRPVGVLAGHLDGITYIDSKGDGRYLISNSKDQSVKLWDMRRLSTRDGQEATRREVAKQNWDYRWQQVPKKVYKSKKTVPGDTSLMTYRGHCVLNTLVRCRFSPYFTTGQRYIYCGCATGAVLIYDVLTGQVVDKLIGHKACVRDVSWHPYENHLTTTSWDCSVVEWGYTAPHDDDEDGASCPSQPPPKKRTARMTPTPHRTRYRLL